MNDWYAANRRFMRHPSLDSAAINKTNNPRPPPMASKKPIERAISEKSHSRTSAPSPKKDQLGGKKHITTLAGYRAKIARGQIWKISICIQLKDRERQRNPGRAAGSWPPLSPGKLCLVRRSEKRTGGAVRCDPRARSLVRCKVET